MDLQQIRTLLNSHAAERLDADHWTALDEAEAARDASAAEIAAADTVADRDDAQLRHQKVVKQFNRTLGDAKDALADDLAAVYAVIEDALDVAADQIERVLVDLTTAAGLHVDARRWSARDVTTNKVNGRRRRLRITNLRELGLPRVELNAREIRTLLTPAPFEAQTR